MARSPLDALRKLAAVLLVLVSMTAGIIGLGLTSEGTWIGLGLIVLAPLGIYGATKLTHDSSGYCDQNL